MITNPNAGSGSIVPLVLILKRFKRIQHEFGFGSKGDGGEKRGGEMGTNNLILKSHDFPLTGQENVQQGK